MAGDVLRVEATGSCTHAQHAAIAAHAGPGMAFTVLQDGREIASAGVGLADVARAIPASPRTMFRVGSVSDLDAPPAS
jgi:CubicO group peptidase (beta-lactamase class C family)